MAEILHHLGCKAPWKQWDKNTYQLVQDFFHQQYVKVSGGDGLSWSLSLDELLMGATSAYVLRAASGRARIVVSIIFRGV